MAKYRIGITEAGDAGVDLSWVHKLGTVDGAILVTKCISPDFYTAVLTHKDKLIVHATFTGYGHSILEPCVPEPYDEFDAIMTLVKGGFPQEKMVIRVDPIIPTEKGLNKALAVIETFMEAGFKRFRISVIDMYPHVRARFAAAGLSLPYGDRFSPDKSKLADVDAMLQEAEAFWMGTGKAAGDLRIECCAEPGLKVPLQCGCISGYDLKLLGLNECEADCLGGQRKACLCYSGKTELLERKAPCVHQCLYCYWRDTAN